MIRAGFCMCRAMSRARVLSPPKQYNCKRSYSSINRSQFSSNASSTREFNFNSDDDVSKPDSESESQAINRVMVVVDSTLEAKAALQWALSHTLQSQDTIILLHITNPSKQGDMELNERAYELLSSMKNTCQVKRPGVQVEIAVQEGKEKGPTIVEEAKQERVSLLVLGQRKRSIMWRLRNIWAGKRSTSSKAVEYCIQNANCMTIAVRRKSSKYGGYLITTKRHKDFWLLA